jgi:indolepyruvate decarboxylase
MRVGYAMQGLAAVTTTYAVGELSALNAVAGSFAERIPGTRLLRVVCWGWA